MLSSAPSPPDYVHSTSAVVLTPAQNQVQDHLQRRHEELQKLIVHQQEELRRVSEQLIMTRYGILPPIVNVTLPFTPGVSSSVSDGDNRASTSTSQQQNTYYELQQMQPHASHQLPHMQQQDGGWRGGPASENSMNQQMDSGQSQSGDEIISYMHLSSQTSSSNQQQHIQHLQQQPQASISSQDSQSNQQQQHQIVSSSEMELMPFQMSEEQAQDLFTN